MHLFMTNKIHFLRIMLAAVAVLFSSLATNAQQVLLDHEWYLAGEKMTIAVEASSAEITSKVAYLELADANGLQASAIIGLSNGRGQGNIFLPSSLHSGYYQLSMYTRMGKQALQMYVPIVNIMQKSSADDIDWIEAKGSYEPTLSTTPLPSKYLETFGRRAENEGHCIYARIHSIDEVTSYDADMIDASLAVVGKEVHVFQGLMVDDSTTVFNTFDVDGCHSVVLSAETTNEQPLQIEILDPFANLKAKKLPHLTFNYNREEVENRSLQMQMAVGDTMVVDSTVLSHEIFSTKPIVSYNLDEYRQFRTIREVLIEYVNFAHRSSKNGHTKLYVGLSDMPALVLLDGMPVKDINRLLDYDARRVHYISIYDNYYTFGKIVYNGIVNIITRTGKLTNFPPEKTSSYLIYDFPQK